MAASPLCPEEIQNYRYLTGSNFETGITATAGGTQTNAYQLSAQMSDLATVATALDAVALPKATGAGVGRHR